MGLTKSEEFSVKENRLAKYAKALAHPARIAILKLLAGRQTCVCGDIVDELPLSQSTVSQHLKELQKAGLIQGTIDGPRSCYCINWETFCQFCDQFTESFSKLKQLRKETYTSYLADGDCKEPGCC